MGAPVVIAMPHDEGRNELKLQTINSFVFLHSTQAASSASKERSR